VEGAGEVVEHGHNVSWQSGAVSPFARQRVNLSLRWHVAGDEEPEEALGQRLLTAWRLWQDLLALGNGQAAEADALIGVQHGGLADEALDAAHATVHLEVSSKNEREDRVH
jgi:hypothetical protein